MIYIILIFGIILFLYYYYKLLSNTKNDKRLKEPFIDIGFLY